jgi:hypothetical protein
MFILTLAAPLVVAAPAVHAAVGKNGLHCSLNSTKPASVRGCAIKTSAAHKTAVSSTTTFVSAWATKSGSSVVFAGESGCPPYPVQVGCDNAVDTQSSQQATSQLAPVDSGTQPVVTVYVAASPYAG